MNTRPFFLFLLAVVLLALFGAARADEAPPRHADGNKRSEEAAISVDGRYVAFSSKASDLVAGDANYASDVFVYDRQTGETKIISRRKDGRQANGDSDQPSISADGRFIAYRTYAANLLPAYAYDGVVVADQLTGETTHISRSSDGTPANEPSFDPAISADGRYVAFVSHATNLDGNVPQLCYGDQQFTCDNIYIHDRQTGQTTLVSQNANGVAGNGYSRGQAISADGRFIAFYSDARNLLQDSPDDQPLPNGNWRVYLYDRETESLSLIAPDASGELADGYAIVPSISADGRLIAFFSATENSEEGRGFHVYDQETGATTLVLPIPSDTIVYDYFYWPVISADGHKLAFAITLPNLVPSDTNEIQDIFVRDLATGETTLVSRHRNGALADDHSWGPVISGDGQVIAFVTNATNLGGGVVADENADIAVHDQATGETTYLTTRPPSMQGDSESRKGTISADGRFVAFESYASNLVPNDGNGLWDIFVRDMATGRTTLIGRDGLTDNQSFAPAISADGRYVAFESLAAAGGALNWDRNVFVYDRQVGVTTLISRPLDGLPPAEGASQNPAISADGGTIAFDSSAYNLVAGDINGGPDIFIYDSQAMTMTKIPRSVVNDFEWLSPCCAALSADGRYVAFTAWVEIGQRLGWPGPDYFSHVYLYDRQTGATTMLSAGPTLPQYDDTSGGPSLSADGRYIAFHSTIDDLVPGDTNDLNDVFVYDRLTGQIELVSRHSNGTQGRYGSLNPSISADGRYVAFESYADNLIDGDNNAAPDVFIHDSQTHQTTLLSRDEDGVVGQGHSVDPSLSPGAEYVVFWSDAALVDGDMNGFYDVFRYDRTVGQMALVSGVILGDYRALTPLVIR